MAETNVRKLMERSCFQYVHDDDDFTRKDYYHVCGFHLQIGVRPLSKLGFGTTVWHAALALCQYFEAEGIRFSDKKVIELGAGTGILGILVALLGGDVTITDQPELLRQIERNVSFNISSTFEPYVKIRALFWGRDHMLFPSDYDYILGSDIIYFYQRLPSIIETLLHLSNEKTIIYFASSMWYSKKSISENYHILSHYFETELVCRYEVKEVNIYKLVRKISTPGDLNL